MIAIVEIAGKQYKVTKGDVLTVERIRGKEGETVTFPKVMLVEDKENVRLGNPTISGASVQAKIIAQMKGDKISVRRYKSKVRERKARGFRSLLTKIEIL